MKTSEISVEYINHMGDDLSVVNSARVSFHKESEWEFSSNAKFLGDESYHKLSDRDEKLISYLARHKHFSPFNHTFLTFKIKAPIFVARQLVKHKFMPWNEVSRRYVDEEPEFYWPDVWRGRPVSSKQGSAGEIELPSFNYKKTVGESLANYFEALDLGCAPEMARMVLPQAMMTEWWWSGTLGAYANMLRLRLDPHTQYESRIVAQLIHKEIKKLFPVSIKALLES